MKTINKENSMGERRMNTKIGIPSPTWVKVKFMGGNFIGVEANVRETIC